MAGARKQRANGTLRGRDAPESMSCAIQAVENTGLDASSEPEAVENESPIALDVQKKRKSGANLTV